jgi:hypothetical protein
MSAVNHTKVARVFIEGMQTHAAPYMKKAAEGLSVSYPKLRHVTRVAHALHRVCKTIRVLYPHVDKLVANVKKIFVKSPARIELFKTKLQTHHFLQLQQLHGGEPGWMPLCIMQKTLKYFVLW